MPKIDLNKQPFYIKQREKNKIDFLARIKAMSDNVKGVYRHICETDIELFALEVSQQAHSSASEKSGIEKCVGKAILNLAMRVFPEAKIGQTLETYIYPEKLIEIPKKASKDVKRIKVYSIDTIFDFIKNNPDEMYYKDEEGNRSKVRRARVFFEKGIECINEECGLIASFFALEQWLDKSFHLDLYGVDAEGDEVLMTIDHIHPKSKGGKDKMDNFQPMCTVCNYLKSDNLYEQEN